jgi:hypothetical protein
VFVTEPAKESPLFGTPNFICTPHLGASTTEAQVNVALQVAEQMADYLVTGGVTNALNMPSLSAEEAPKLRPYMALAEKLGSLVGQLAHDNLTKIAIEVEGAAAQLNPKPITGAVLAGLMKQYSQSVNMVNAPFLAKERGLDVREVRHDREGEYRTLVRVTVGTSQGERSVAGTLFGNGQAAPGRDLRHRHRSRSRWRHALHRQHRRPGFIGRSARCWASPASTSARSTSAAARPVAKRCCCSRSTARSARTCWPKRAASGRAHRQGAEVLTSAQRVIPAKAGISGRCRKSARGPAQPNEIPACAGMTVSCRDDAPSGERST